MKNLIKKYEDLLMGTINSDDLTWDDLGCDEPIEGFQDVNDYLENGGDSEFDEGQQTEIRIYNEIIEDLKKHIIKVNPKLAKIAKLHSVL